MTFGNYLFLVGVLISVSIAGGCFGLYQYFVYERKRKQRIQKMCEQLSPTFRELYEDNKY